MQYNEKYIPQVDFILYDKQQATNIYNYLVNPIIYISANEKFDIKYRDIFDNYQFYVSDEALEREWQGRPDLKFWQNQVNFAVWCATTGCGVGIEHLEHPLALVRSVYRFHVYYQIRRILFKMECPLPNDHSFNQFDNPFNASEYEAICNEFNIDKRTDWKSKNMFFTEVGGYGHVPIYSMIPHLKDGYVHFITRTSIGFSRAGITRINDSIRSYVWLILGSQAQTRTSIIGSGTAFDAQNQLLSNLESSIYRAEDLSKSIANYQDTLKYARSKVDFVVGIGLYMIPSDMNLRIQTTVDDYNNEIVIATDKMMLGQNRVNNKKIMPIAQDVVTPTATVTTPTNSISPSKTSITPTTTTVAPITPAVTPIKDIKLSHGESKFLIWILFASLVGGVYLYKYSK